MSSLPHIQSLKSDYQSEPQKIFSSDISHSTEGECLSKNLLSPHPSLLAGNFTQNNSNEIYDVLCGKKRANGSSLGQCQANNFKPNWAPSRLSSTTEDNLQAKNGLNQTGFGLQQESSLPLTSLAGILSSMKSRGRTISSISETTNNSFSCTSSRCYKWGRKVDATNDSPFGTPAQFLTPNYFQGKICK